MEIYDIATGFHTHCLAELGQTDQSIVYFGSSFWREGETESGHFDRLTELD